MFARNSIETSAKAEKYGHWRKTSALSEHWLSDSEWQSISGQLLLKRYERTLTYDYLMILLSIIKLVAIGQ